MQQLPPLHRHWLEHESLRLLDFGRASCREDSGFGWLDADGRLTPGEPQHLYIAGRMTHVYSLGSLLGVPGCAPIAAHGVRVLSTLYRDAEHGGWFTALDASGRPLNTDKAAYPHSFVILAGASASIAQVAGGAELLEDALAVVDERFWDDRDGMVVEQWDRAFTTLLDYRGLNANMHMLEAYLAAFSATGRAELLERSLRISERACDAARAQGWRLPEHFDASWRPLLGFNAERRDDPFKPYGSTVGHWFEWARLLLLVEQACAEAGRAAPAWLRESALALFDLGVAEGWRADGRDGFVYTVDWEGRPAVRNRLHWVAAEAIGAAATLLAVTGEPRYRHWYDTWWDYVRAYLVDTDRGSWHHELDVDNRPSSLIKKGKADVYHALQATLVPLLPVRPGLARAVADAADRPAPQSVR
ncbi:AGE family epimerase/isomerase [Georgenia thermotolerans]|uniref:AGE family epimerase/isomerase n=1 Tax=Georgenia thermotolerans TaxID=527326 RepID=A0A7J5UQV3_9MICO|nr:AGE family epimerase/isomerase [Georgenia thermotolerans]KAE8764806.1 AGE family epimerase/isomerase [Georgenia thermotolerans]